MACWPDRPESERCKSPYIGLHRQCDAQEHHGSSEKHVTSRPPIRLLRLCRQSAVPVQESALLSHLPSRDAAGRGPKLWLSGASGTAKLPIKYWLGMAYRPEPATSCSLLIVGKLIKPCGEMDLRRAWPSPGQYSALSESSVKGGKQGVS